MCLSVLNSFSTKEEDLNKKTKPEREKKKIGCLINWNTCGELKNSAQVFTKLVSSRNGLQIFHFAEIYSIRPETIQLEH